MIYIAHPDRTVSTSHVDPTNRKKEQIVRTVIAKDHIEEGVS